MRAVVTAARVCADEDACRRGGLVEHALTSNRRTAAASSSSSSGGPTLMRTIAWPRARARDDPFGVIGHGSRRGGGRVRSIDSGLADRVARSERPRGARRRSEGDAPQAAERRRARHHRSCARTRNTGADDLLAHWCRERRKSPAAARKTIHPTSASAGERVKIAAPESEAQWVLDRPSEAALGR